MRGTYQGGRRPGSRGAASTSSAADAERHGRHHQQRHRGGESEGHDEWETASESSDIGHAKYRSVKREPTTDLS